MECGVKTAALHNRTPYLKENFFAVVGQTIPNRLISLFKYQPIER